MKVWENEIIFTNRRKTISKRITENKEEEYPSGEIVQRLENGIGLPIVLENDVSASTIAEFSKLDQFEDGSSDFVQIALGEGIGAGIIIDT